jgi:CHAT domain-containing protein
VRYIFSATSQALARGNLRQGKGFAGFAPTYPARTDSPRWVAFPGRNLGPLFNNQREVTEIEAVVAGKAFLGALATEATFRQEARSYQVLHLAMHAVLDDEDPLRSCLVFTPEATPGQPERTDGVLHAYEIYHLPLEAELAVLSACHSGQGDFRPGEGLVSLGRAFAYAGCANTVMSLWQADDAAAATLMGHFYQHLAEGLPKDEALRQARLDYLASEALTHPHFWGNFVLFGDGEPVEVTPAGTDSPLFWGKIGLLVLGLVGTGIWWSRRRKAA